jgi:hypothetical protein
MYLKQETTGSEPVLTPALGVAMAAALVVTIALGVYPRPLFELAEASAQTLGISGLLASVR